MRKFITAFIVLMLFAVSTSAKILVLTSNKAPIYDNAQWLKNDFFKVCKTLGVKYDVVLCEQTSLVWTRANSGNYSMAVVLGLPAMNSSYDTEGELAAAGWDSVSVYMIPNRSAREFPIPLFLPASLDFANTAAGPWKQSISGICGTVTSMTSDYQPWTDSAGDSIYVHCHATTYREARVSDSLAWVQSMIWLDKAVSGGRLQKYTRLWKVDGTGNHDIIYLYGAANSWATPFLAAVIAMYEPVTPVELPIIIDWFGYADYTLFGRSGGAALDTVSLGRNLRDIMDYVIANDMKLEFLVDTYHQRTQNVKAFDDAIVRAASYPDNFRFTYMTQPDMSGLYDWLGFAATRTQAQIEAYIAASFDTTANYPYLEAVFPRTRLSAVSGGYAGTLGGATTGSYDVLGALAAQNVSNIYMLSNVGATMMPVTRQYPIMPPLRTWIGSDMKELRCHSMTKNLTDDLAALGSIDSLKICYMARNSTVRGVYSAQHMKYFFGGYTPDGSISSGTYAEGLGTQTSKIVALRSKFTVGTMFGEASLTGGSNSGGGYVLAGIDSSNAPMEYVLWEMKNTAAMANHIVSTFGRFNQPLFVYKFLSDTKWDRMTGRQFVNSHVTKR